MWIVRIALDRPYTFVVLALLILILSPVVILRTPVDIFPNINIPVIAVAWQYTGLNPEELEGRLTSVYERILTTTVDNIEHIESTTVNGQAVVKIFLQPGTSLDTANAQVTAVSQTILRQLPRCFASADHQLQRFQRADFAACTQRQRPLRAAIERYGAKLHQAAARPRPRSGCSLPVWGQAAAGDD